MSRGDHIYIQLFSYTHHGIDLGNGTAIEYSRNEGVRLISKKDFSKNQKVYTEQYTWCFSIEETIKKAYSRLGEKKYCLLSSNCEHFARWCKTGVNESKQIKKLERVAHCTTKKSIQRSIPVALGNISGQALAVSAAKKSLNPIAKALVNTGIKQAPKTISKTTVGVAALGGLATGIATDIVVNKMYEDKSYLSRYEREVRKKSRNAGQIGSTAGAIGGVVAGGIVGGTVGAAAIIATPIIGGLGAAIGVYKLNKKR